MQLGRRRVAISNFESRRLTVPKARDLSSKDDREAAQFAVKIRRVSFRSSAKQTNRTHGLVLSFPLFRLSRSDNLPRRCDLRMRREARFIRAPLIARFLPCPRGCSSAGRAPALQAGGQRFESAHLHQHIDNRIGLSRSPECRKAISGSSFFFVVTAWPFLQRLKSGYRSNKLVRVRGGCLGTKSRRKTRLPAISVGELEANDDPAISEWGNPLEVMFEHRWLNT